MKKYLLKNKLKQIYIKLQTDFEYLDCGHHMACIVSTDYYNLCKQYNETADKLAKLDDKYPTHRWKLN